MCYGTTVPADLIFGAGIIFCRTRERTEELPKQLRKRSALLPSWRRSRRNAQTCASLVVSPLEDRLIVYFRRLFHKNWPSGKTSKSAFLEEV